MRRSVLPLVAVFSVACRSTPPPAPQPLVPQTSGSIAVIGVHAPVRVVRDRTGVPHIFATSPDDLFFAQGFVQAQDRLFQMDLWRRASQGRLSEVLGPNFIDRDGMTRRIQYHGDRAAEWTAYGPDAEAIATAFVRGINAYVSMARARLPEEFVVAGWGPAYWRADDLLNRTDAFLSSGDALAEVARAHYPDAVSDALRLVGTPPFLIGSAPPAPQTHARDGTRLTAPSPRYLVHLVGPGWNVIGATAPWLPGVAIGHNDRVSWDAAPVTVDTQDLFVEQRDRTTVTATSDIIRVKGRGDAITFLRETTPRGLVIATDHEHNRVYTLRWTGFELGGAAELAAPAIDRAANEPDFYERAKRWRFPARRFLVQPLAAAGSSLRDIQPPSARSEQPAATPVVFAHFLGVSTRQPRFNVGPVPRPADDRQTRVSGTHAINAPGQSGWTGSPHYADAAKPWSAGEMFELWFSDEAIRANAEATLMLIPKR
ncbi:MAG TPA: penicillin acylase family protein [Vicinamibacterales bacterium]|nr:penicillin acylase family protein [Vicinamibacterales bacterium]